MGHNSAVSLLLISDIMSIPNEALQKLIHEIESQALVAQQQIGLTKSQVASKQREQRLIKLTLGEVSSLPEDAVEKLNKRLLYLETTQKNSREHIEQMLRGR